MTPTPALATDATVASLWRQLAVTWHAHCPSPRAGRGSTLDEKSIRLIRDSFAQVTAIAAPAAILFYGRLFRIAPAMRGLFTRSDRPAQGMRLIAGLDHAVSMLDRPDRLLPAMRDLMVGLGLRPEHRGPVGEALEWMLEECLAEDFTPELRAAWSGAYRALTAPLMEDDSAALAA